MSDGTILTEPAKSEPTPPAPNGILGRKTGDLASFKSSPGTGSPPAGKSSAPSGKKEKGKIGRPPKNAAGFSQDKIDTVASDPEIEAAREEFEAVLVELLAATTENFAESRYLLLCKKYPDAEARGLADKFLLTDKEKTYFGGVAVRLWRKYLGDKYLFTDEGIAGVYCLKYLLRNWEGIAQSRKIEAELNAKPVAKPATDRQQPGL